MCSKFCRHNKHIENDTRGTYCLDLFFFQAVCLSLVWNMNHLGWDGTCLSQRGHLCWEQDLLPTVLRAQFGLLIRCSANKLIIQHPHLVMDLTGTDWQWLVMRAKLHPLMRQRLRVTFSLQFPMNEL